MKVTALLTGRGNNTLKDKNVIPVRGHPLLWYPAMAARGSDRIDSFYVSSDCPKILSAAAECGYQPIVRPAELAGPQAQHYDAIMHALRHMQAQGLRPDLLIVLLANSPTVLTRWIDDCIDLLVSNPAASAAVPVSMDMDHHPYRAKRLGADGFLRPFVEFGAQKISTNRQDLPPNFFLCHNFWALRTTALENPVAGDPPWTFMGPSVLPYEVEHSFDVHDMNDVRRAEEWLSAHGLPA